MLTPTTHTYSGIRDAVNKAASQGGGTIQLETGDYVDDGSNTIIIPCDNIHIVGVGGSRIVAPPTGDIDLFSSQPNLFNPVLLTKVVNKYDTMINVMSSFYFKARNFVMITRTVVPDVIVWSQICYIKEIQGDALHITPFIPFDIHLDDTYTIQPITLLKNIRMNNIIFDGNNNTSLARGFRLNGLYNSQFENLTFQHFVGASAMFLDVGFSNHVNNIQFENCGTMDENDLMFSYQTNSQLGNVRSLNASGFGPMFIRCNFCQISNVSSLSATYRGIKFLGSLYNLVNNVQSHDSINTTGIALSFGSSFNQLINCSACNNQGEPENADGLWFSGHGNNDNVISNSVFLHNKTSDIFVDANDFNNVIINTKFDTLYNGGCSMNCSNRIDPSINACWFKRMMKSLFGNCCCCQ